MLVLLFNYLQVTNFFWMLVEGLYLHTLIVWAYTTERIKFWFYALIGWGESTIYPHLSCPLSIYFPCSLLYA